jgi:holin-like protein
MSRLARVPGPGSVIGLLLLLILLRTRVLREQHVGEAADFLVKIMPVLFLPITAGLLASYGLISAHIVGFLTVTLVSTVAVFAATGLATQGVIRHARRKAPVPDAPPPVDEEAGEDET